MFVIAVIFAPADPSTLISPVATVNPDPFILVVVEVGGFVKVMLPLVMVFVEVAVGSVRIID